jgi:hypothetical protein
VKAVRFHSQLQRQYRVNISDADAHISAHTVTVTALHYTKHTHFSTVTHFTVGETVLIVFTIFACPSLLLPKHSG